MKARVLLVEDSPQQAKLIKENLGELGYTVEWAKGGSEGLQFAKTLDPDIIILDVVMEDMDGYTVCRWLKLNDSTRDIPIIMLTVKGDVEDRVEGLHVGADDYLPKPFDTKELEARMFAAMRAKTAQTELKKRNIELENLLHKVEFMAITDPLTGLYNRRRFVDVLRREYATSKRYENPLSCIIIDIDHFKKINDTHGHKAGDKILQEFSLILTANLREVDVPARYGGEEFTILLPHTSKENALIVANRIKETVREMNFDASGAKITFTVSIGIADVNDIDEGGEEHLIQFADVALYQAKVNGRDQVVTYSEELKDIRQAHGDLKID